MNAQMMGTYMAEITLQCRFALRAYGEIESLLATINEERTAEAKILLTTSSLGERLGIVGRLLVDKPAQNGFDVFFFVHSFVSHAANVSKLLWPVKGTEKKTSGRGTDLLSALGVSLGSIAVLQLRDYRNHIEHYDERLDTWVHTSPAHSHVDMIVGSVNGPDAKDMFRVLDPITKEATFWGSRCNLSDIAEALSVVSSAADKWLANHDPGQDFLDMRRKNEALAKEFEKERGKLLGEKA